jgi:hypothetical protein
MKNYSGARAKLFASAVCSVLALACGNETQRVEHSQLDDFARFGRSVDISINRAVIGAYQEGSGEGAAYVFIRQGDTWSLEARIVSPSPGDEQFGDSVSISGNTIAVGAPLNDQPGAFRSGSVYVYQRTTTTGAWELQATLSSSGGHQAWEQFGVEVAVDGNLLAVGAVDRDQAGQTDAGGVFVFERTGTSWPLLQQLTAPMPVAQDKFGNAIDVVGQNIVIAAVGRERGAITNAGAVYVYARPGALFSLAQTIQPSDGATNDVFGTDVALEVGSAGARRLVVGAEGCDPGKIENAGAVYVYDSAAAGAFTQTQKLIAGDPTAGAIFGTEVALAGTRIAVGASAFFGAAPQSGAAYTFVLSGTWSQQQKLQRNPSDANATFGSSVALFGTNLLVGASNESIGTLFDSTGAAHAYFEVGGVFEHMHVLTAQGSDPSLAYGMRLSLGGDRMAVLGVNQVDVYRRDAYGWSEEQHFPSPSPGQLSGVAVSSTTLAIAGRRSGPAFPIPQGFIQIYTRTGDAWTLQQEIFPDLASSSFPEESTNSMVLALQGDTLVLGARRWNGGDGRVFIYERSGTVWTQAQLFMSPQQTTNFDMNFGNQVRLDGNTLAVAEVPSSGTPGSPRNGNVFIYLRASATADFTQVQVLSAPVPAPSDGFGKGIALNGNLLATMSGAGTMLRVYRRTAGIFEEIWSTPSPDMGGIGPFEVGLALSGDRLAVGASMAPVESEAAAGEIRVLLRQSDDTYAPDTALRTVPTANLNLGRAIAMDGERIIASSSNNTGRVYNFEL